MQVQQQVRYQLHAQFLGAAALRLRAALNIVIGLDVNEDSPDCSRWPKGAKVKVQLEPIQRIHPWASLLGVNRHHRSTEEP